MYPYIHIYVYMFGAEEEEGPWAGAAVCRLVSVCIYVSIDIY